MAAQPQGSSHSRPSKHHFIRLRLYLSQGGLRVHRLPVESATQQTSALHRNAAAKDRC